MESELVAHVGEEATATFAFGVERPVPEGDLLILTCVPAVRDDRAVRLEEGSFAMLELTVG